VLDYATNSSIGSDLEVEVVEATGPATGADSVTRRRCHGVQGDAFQGADGGGSPARWARLRFRDDGGGAGHP
jgi:hypothetical protein